MDCSPPGSSVHAIFQARILEWVAISFSRGSSQPRDRTRVSCTAGRFFTNWATREKERKVKLLSLVQLFATPWTVAYKAPPSMGFSRQEYWSGLPFPSPGDLPDPGIELESPALQAHALPSEPPGKPPVKTGQWATLFVLMILIFLYPQIHKSFLYTLTFHLFQLSTET